jgi:hypothetical protein
MGLFREIGQPGIQCRCCCGAGSLRTQYHCYALPRWVLRFSRPRTRVVGT